MKHLHLFLFLLDIGYIPQQIEEFVDISFYSELSQFEFIKLFSLFVEIFFRQILLPEVFLKLVSRTGPLRKPLSYS
jgi:hypothetical protein